MNRSLYHRIKQEYWVEFIFVPPFLLLLCYLLYGPPYFQSWRNFLWMTLPWMFTAIVSPILCHWVRHTALSRYRQLDDWPKRVAWSVTGYFFATVGLAKLTYYLLCLFHVGNLAPSQRNFYLLLVIAGMCVLTITTIYEGITYFEKWKGALIETEQLEKLQLETQFQSLQSQLNPHFLFNSLNVLSSLIAENPRKAEDFVDELSNVYRYLLRANEHELATVREELRFIRSFFHLLETRHDRGIQLNIQVDSSLLDRKLPALALQILVENAVKHNEISPEYPLSIEIFSVLPGPQAPTGYVEVRNNLRRKASQIHSNQVGLDNLRRRYALLGRSGFTVQDDGRYFWVSLPLL